MVFFACVSAFLIPLMLRTQNKQEAENRKVARPPLLAIAEIGC